MFDTTLAILTVVAMLLLPFLGIPLFILGGLGMMKIGKNEGKKNLSLLSWIPIANILFLSYLAEKSANEKLQNGKLTIALAVSMFLMLFFGGFFILTTVGILLYSFYCIANRYSDKALAHTLIASVTLGFSVPVSLFRFRKKQAVY